MTLTIEQIACKAAPPAMDLAGTIRLVLANSAEPLTPAKIRAALPPAMRSVSPEQLADTLERQVAAQVFILFPKYRSPQDRYWDRPMPVHLENLVRNVLRRGPLSWSEIRKHLPDYAKTLAESVVEEQVAKGRLFRHPSAGPRAGPRFGLEPADPRPYLKTELNALVGRLEQIGFPKVSLRSALLDLIRQEEWGQRAPVAAPTGAGFHFVRPLVRDPRSAASDPWSAVNFPTPREKHGALSTR